MTATRYQVAFASTVGLSLGFSVVGLTTFGMFVIPLSEAFGWGRGDISVAYAVMCYIVAALAPLAGLLIDRFGVRRVVLPSIVAFALTFGSLALLQGSLAHYYAVYVLLALTGIGTAPTSYTRVVVLWFDERRGLALGVALAGVGIGTALLPLYVQYWMGKHGWQAGYLSIAALLLVFSLPVVWRWLWEPPALQSAGNQAPELPGNPLKVAITGRVFWQLAAGFVLLGIFTAAVLTHLVPMLRDRGLSAEAAAQALSVLGVALIFGRLLTGWLLDRYFAPHVVLACLVTALAGVALLISGAQGMLALTAVALMGFGIGAELDFMSYLISRYQGLRAYGRLYGIVYGAFILGAGLGPLLMGYGQQRHGNYDAALLQVAAIVALTLPLFGTLGRYPVFAPAAQENA
jgi:MFS family permease